METQTSIIIPRGNPGLEPAVLNLGHVVEAEARIHEIAFLTPSKAPELLALFNNAYLDLMKMLAFLGMELAAAKRHVSLRRSEVLLDISDEMLKKKNLTSSQDLRAACVDADTEYQRLLERQQTIRAYEELLHGRAKSLEMAYTSTKKVLGERTPMSWSPKTEPTTPVEDQQPGTNTSPRSGFAKPKYNF